jgi:hypothetical protein
MVYMYHYLFIACSLFSLIAERMRRGGILLIGESLGMRWSEFARARCYGRRFRRLAIRGLAARGAQGQTARNGF